MKLQAWLTLIPGIALLAGCAPESPESTAPLGSTREAMTVCPGSQTLDGVDISHYDGDIDWGAVRDAGKTFAFAKATEGLTFTDPQFAQNWADMKANGVVRGAYHYFHANDDPIQQADFLLSVMGPLEPGDLPPALDLEVSDNEPASVVSDGANAWLDHVAAAIGQMPIVYTSRRVVTEDLGNAMGLDQHGLLWDANWGVTCPDLPDTYATFSFWQTSATGTVPGISAGAVDLDVFNGGLPELAAIQVPSPSTSTSSGAGGAGAGGASATTTGAGAGGGAATGSGSGASTGDGTGTSASTGTSSATAGHAGSSGGGQARRSPEDSSESGGCSVGAEPSRGAGTIAIALGALACAAIRRRSGRVRPARFMRRRG